MNHDTRMDANSDLCEKHGTTMSVFFVAYVEPTTAVLRRSSRRPVMVVSVTGVSVEEGPSS